MKRARAVFAACVLASGSARAEVPDSARSSPLAVVRFAFWGADGCPTEQDFVAQVSTRTTHFRIAGPAERARTFFVTVKELPDDATDRFVGALMVQEEDGRKSERSLAGADCAQVALSSLLSLVFACSSAESGATQPGEGPAASGADPMAEPATGAADASTDTSPTPPSKPDANPLSALSVTKLATLAAPITRLEPVYGPADLINAVTSPVYDPCRSNVQVFSPSMHAPAAAPAGRWGLSPNADGRWLVALEVGSSDCGNHATTAFLFDLASPAPAAKSLPTTAGAAADDTFLGTDAAHVFATSFATNTIAWTVSATNYAMSRDEKRVLVYDATSTRELNASTGAVLRTVASSSAYYLTMDCNYLRSDSVGQTTLIAPNGTTSVLAGSVDLVSPDQKKVIWRTAAVGPTGAAYFVRTLATGSDVALARPYSRFSSDSNWIEVVGGAYPVAGGALAPLAHAQFITVASNDDHSVLVSQDSTGSHGTTPKYAVQTAAGSTDLPWADYFDVSPVPGTANGDAVFVFSNQSNPTLYLVDVKSGVVGTPRVLRDKNAKGGAIAIGGGVVYYLANSMLNAITYDGKFERVVGPSSMITATGGNLSPDGASGIGLLGRWVLGMTTLYSANGAELDAIAPIKYQ